MATIEQIKAFNQTRSVRNSAYLCYAPVLSLNFDQTGNVTACCFNRQYVLGSYPENTIDEIWSGEKVKKLRDSLASNKLELGCGLCDRMIVERNFESVLINHFDDYVPLIKDQQVKPENNGLLSSILGSFYRKKEEKPNQAPLVFEFEISNHCNLECIMCGGKWSSAIRKNREKLPPLKSPYDKEFVNQVKNYLPQLARANFLGGEPFLIGPYYDIWEAIIEVNPNVDVGITSNGTMLSSRARGIIERLPNCRITLSIDSLNKSTWESIRRNGCFEDLENNIHWLLGSKKLKSFSVCPMIQNWKEIPDIMRFCDKNDLDIYFNVVYGPLGGKLEGVHKFNSIESGSATELLPDVSLQTMGQSELDEVIELYSKQTFPKHLQIQLQHLIAQLKSWRAQKKE
ncbi:MAG: radical SAM protein [Flavobacteriales bacterium]|nr:radical SAM protein [Flavobacteriales bacterium]